VWREDVPATAGEIAELARALPADERARAAALAGPARARFVAGRAALRKRLASYAGLSPGQVAIVEGANGKPEARVPSGVEFSVSHSGGLVLLAFGAGTPVGVDVEAIRPRADLDALAARFLAPAERDAIRAAADPLLAFLEIWTVKEACLKALGIGLAGLQAVAVAPGSAGPTISVGGDSASWTAATFRPAPGYVAAVVRRPV
jgi:4'-phosphopantetheinyl transferase